jgi:hypothetical protein
MAMALKKTYRRKRVTKKRSAFRTKVRAIAKGAIMRNSETKVFDQFSNNLLSTATVPSLGGSRVVGFINLSRIPAAGTGNSLRIGNQIRALSARVRVTMDAATPLIWGTSPAPTSVRIV